MKKRLLGIAMAFAMFLTLLPAPAWAAEEDQRLCPHHLEHTAECGYLEPTEDAPEGAPCTYVCQLCTDAEEPEAVQEDPEAVPEDPEAVPEVPEAVPEEPEAVPEDPETVPEEPEAEPEGPISQVQALIDALPEAEAITAESAGDVQARLAAIDEARLALTQEDQDGLDMTRYTDAVSALLALESMEGADVPEVLAAAAGTHPIGEGSLVITENGTYTVTGRTTEYHITVASGIEATIILSGVSIDMSGRDKTSAIDLELAGACTITLAEGTTNVLKAGKDRPGIYVPNGKQVTFNGTGELLVTGGNSWPGIGRMLGTGNILIEDGYITAAGGSNGAGIGGSWGHGGGTIAISGGIVTATGGNDAAGIGGGLSGAGGTTTISGGSVTATGGVCAAGIGGGNMGSGGVVTISGGIVTAQAIYSNNDPAAIGGGGLGGAGTVTISGGTVKALGAGGQGIGAGNGYNEGEGQITIRGGVVTTNGIGQNVYGIKTATTISGGVILLITEGTYIHWAGINPDDQANWNCAVFEEDKALSLYGETVLLSSPVPVQWRIRDWPYAEIADGQHLIIDENVTLLCNGAIVNHGTITNHGRLILSEGMEGIYGNPVEGNQPVSGAAQVALDANGGAVDPDKLWVTAGWTYVGLPVPVRPSYRFDGWFTAPTGGTRVTEETEYNAAYTTLYAHWIRTHVQLDANGGTVEPDALRLGSGGTYQGLPVPVRQFYQFDGWFTEPTGGVQVTEETEYNEAYETLYAHWTRSHVQLDANGGTVEPDALRLDRDGTYEGLPVPVRKFHHFDGWFTEPTGGVEVTEETAYNEDYEILYAHWTREPPQEITGETTVFENGGAYIARGSVTINRRIELEGAATLILEDGCDLTINGGIHVPTGRTLTINGGPQNTGRLTANGRGSEHAGIGGNNGEDHGWTTINGGTVTANAGPATGNISGTGIGGGSYGNGGYIRINGGIVYANGSMGGSGIGGGGGHPDDRGGSAGNIVINGNAFVQARGGGEIGGGWYCDDRIEPSSISFEKGLILKDGTVTKEGWVYGDTALPGSVVIPENFTITPQNGGRLTVPEGVTLTNRGMIQNVPITNYGTIINVRPGSISPAAEGNVREGFWLSFDAKGGSTPGGQACVIGEPYQLPESTRANYTFDGWYTQASGGERVENGDQIPDLQSQTLYARWLGVPCTVSFAANGGTVDTASKTVHYDGPYGELPVPTHPESNLLFAGWYTDPTDGTRVEASTVVSTMDDHALYARWKAFSHTSYIDENGENATAKAFPTSRDPMNWGTGWYVVDSSYTASERIRVTGDVKLILADGFTLTASKGIAVNVGTSLTIYRQSAHTGVLIASAPGAGASTGTGAAIGADREKQAGTIVINGGIITAKITDYGGGCIGQGGWDGKVGAGAVTINGGYLKLDCKTGGEGAFGVRTERTINGGVIEYTSGNATDSITGATMNNCIVFNKSNTGTVYGDPVIDFDYTLAQGKTIPVGDGQTLTNRKTLTVAQGATLTNNGTFTIAHGGTLESAGTLAGGGTFQTGNLTVDMITVTDGLVYNGSDLTETIQENSSISETATTIGGKEFRFDDTSWSGPTVEKVDDLHYTVTYTHTGGGEPVTKTVTLTQSGTEFGDGAVKTYKGEAESGEFTYGDTVTVKAKPTPTGAAPASRLRAAPNPGQMALYYGDTLLSGPVEANAEGKYIMTATVQALVEANAPYNQEITLTVKYGETDRMAAAQGEVTVTLQKASLTITGATLAEKTYDGDTAATVTGVTFQGLVNGETLTMGEGRDYTAAAAFNSPNVHEATTATVTVTLNNQNYSLAENTYTLTGQEIKKAPLNETGLTISVAPSLQWEQVDETFTLTGNATLNGGQPESTAVEYSIDGTSWQDELKFTNIQPNTEITVSYRLKATENYNAGTTKTHGTESPRLSAQLTVTMAGWTYGETAPEPRITCIPQSDGTPTVEYKLKDAVDGTYSADKPTDAGTYVVRVTYAETEKFNKLTATAEFTIAPQQEATPSAAIDYQNETLTGLTAGAKYEINGAEKEAREDGTILIDSGWFNATLSIVKTARGNNYTGSPAQTLEIPPRPATPSGSLKLTKAKNSVTVTNTGAFDGCEFSKDGTTWSESASFTGLTAGTAYNIQVRVQATTGSFRSEAMSQTVTTVNSDGSTVLKPGESTTVEGTTVTNNGGTVTTQTGNTTTTITPPAGGDAAVSGNGTVTALAGATVQTGENGPVITVGQNSEVSGNGSVTVPAGGSVTVPNGENGETAITAPENSAATVAPAEDGKLTVSGGCTVKPENGPEITLPQGGTVDQDGTVTADKVQIGNTTVTGENITVAPDGSVTIPGSGTVVTGDKTINIPASGGSMTPDGEVTYSVIVTFDSQGGSQVESQTIAVNTPVNEPIAPTRSGYNFGGWYTDSTCKTAWNFDTAVSEDMTLYAKWTVRSSGGSGGGTVSGKPTVTVVGGEGGKAEAGRDGTVTVTPEVGYEIVKITVNGKKVKIPADGKLTGLKRTDTVEVTFGEVTVPVSQRFHDVPAGAWYEEAVQFVVDNGLFYGTSDTTFNPNSGMTRGMLATVLYRLEKEPGTSADNMFNDVADGMYYTEAIAWAAENGIVTGYGASLFGPNDPITREQLAAILWRYAGRPASAGTLDGFTDADKVSPWAKDALCWAVENNIMGGKGNGILDPKGKATRAQVASMLMRYCDTLK